MHELKIKDQTPHIAKHVLGDCASSEVYLMDCMELMAQYPDNYFDLAVVDPPYGKRPTRGKNGFGSSETINFQPDDDKWDVKPNKEYFEELFRVSKNQIIWGGNYFIENLYATNCFLIWDKLTGENPYADCEMAWTSFNSVVKKYTKLWLGSHCKDVFDLIHPTQKPVSLYEWIFKNYTTEGMKILDTHLGSGNIAVACHYFGVDLVGCEIDTEYYNGALKNYKDNTAQTLLTF